MTTKNIITNEIDTNRISNTSELFRKAGIYKDDDDLGTIALMSSAN